MANACARDKAADGGIRERVAPYLRHQHCARPSWPGLRIGSARSRPVPPELRVNDLTGLRRLTVRLTQPRCQLRGDCVCRHPERVRREMGIAAGGLDVLVAEEFAYNR